MWRAATQVPPADLRPTGPIQSSLLARTWQLRLDKQLVAADIAQDQQRTNILVKRIPNLIKDSFRPTWVYSLEHLNRLGFDAVSLVQTAAAKGPLPDDHPAAALWWRILDELPPPKRGNSDQPTPAVPRPSATTPQQEPHRPPHARLSTLAPGRRTLASTAIALSELEVGSAARFDAQHRLTPQGQAPRTTPARIDWLGIRRTALQKSRQWTSGCCTGFPRLPYLEHRLIKASWLGRLAIGNDRTRLYAVQIAPIRRVAPSCGLTQPTEISTSKSRLPDHARKPNQPIGSTIEVRAVTTPIIRSRGAVLLMSRAQVVLDPALRGAPPSIGPLDRDERAPGCSRPHGVS